MNQKPDILVVEDNDLNRELLLTILSKMNRKADFAINGEEAVEKALENDYKLIFMDLRMPIMGGLEASQKILDQKDPNIVAVTANTDQEDVEQIHSIGIKSYISKPYSLSSIRKAVEEYCD